MKTRTDFVSNSSSSSFICALDDNQYGILLSNFTCLDFDEYFQKFGMRDVLDYWDYADKNTKIKFVPDDEYQKKFMHDVFGLLPMSAKDSFEQLKLHSKQNKPTILKLQYNSPECTKFYNKEKVLSENVVAICREVLRPAWNDVKFCYQEIDDNSGNDCAELFDCWSNEDLTTQKFDYIDELKPMKFRRIFSNH